MLSGRPVARDMQLLPCCCSFCCTQCTVQPGAHVQLPEQQAVKGWERKDRRLHDRIYADWSSASVLLALCTPHVPAVERCMSSSGVASLPTPLENMQERFGCTLLNMGVMIFITLTVFIPDSTP